MDANNWDQCLTALKAVVPEKEFNTWVRPLHAITVSNGLKLLAPNRFAVDWVNAHLLPRLFDLLSHDQAAGPPEIYVEIGSRDSAPVSLISRSLTTPQTRRTPKLVPGARLHADWKFNTFVRGRSNALAYDAALEIAVMPGHAYNPLFLCGGVGLGKTHLMQAIAHLTRERDSGARVAYVHSERFVSDMVRALQHNAMNDFKTAYRSLDALMIDDIQFFANKDRTQEDFFHTFNDLLEGQHQIILTCDRSERGRGPRGPLEVAIRLGTHCRHRAAGTRDVRGDFDFKGTARRCEPAGGRGVLHRQADPLECA